eukprot:gene7769-9114_t
MASRRLGQTVFSPLRSVFGSQVRGIKVGLQSCCGTNYALTPRVDSHHHSSARTVGSAIRSISTPLFENSTPSTFAIRSYANVPVAPTPTSLLRSLCDSEITDFKTLIPENEDSSFLEENGFALSKDGEYAYIKKTTDDGSEVTIRFDLVESMGEEPYDGQDEMNEDEEDQDEEDQEDDEEKPENEEEAEEDEDNEDNEDNEDGEEDGNAAHEHPYEISIKRNVNGKDVTVTFGCFASADGSYTVSGFYYGSFNEPANPVDIGGTSADFQDNILLFLQQYGVSEGLSFFIHDYVHNKKLNDYIESFETLKEFIGSK